MGNKTITQCLEKFILSLSYFLILTRQTRVEAFTEISVTIYEPVQVGSYEGYPNIWFLQYHIPEDTVLANFSFLAERSSSDCDPTVIYVNLQEGGYPVLAPRNESFPADFYLDGSMLHNLSLAANNSLLYHSLSCPITGNWFAIIYSLTEADSIQKLTDKKCTYLLSSNLTTLALPDVEELTVGSTPFTTTITLPANPTYYRFVVSDRTWKYSLKIDGCKVNLTETDVVKCPVQILTRSQGLATYENSENRVDCSDKHKYCNLEVVGPRVNQYQYITFSKTSDLLISFYLTIIAHECGVANQCLDITHMYRIAEVSTDFRVTYALKPTRLEWVENVVKVEEQTSRIFQFPVYPFQDSGGTALFKAVFNNTNFKNSTQVNITICISRDVIPVINGRLSCEPTVAMTLTSLTNQSSVVIRHYPYPRSGTWYAAMQAKCFQKSANHSSNVEKSCSEDEDFLVKFDLGILPCYQGGCNGVGGCKQYISGILIYSACSCNAGWRGYGCTDDSEVKPAGTQLLYSLLLTLSNMMFIPAISIALYKRYYPEALVYFSNMFFSTFYHACDMATWSTYSLCIMPYHVLSYCDFFCSILSIWVTLVAMAQLRQPFYSLAHTLGAVGLSMGVEWQQHGFIPYIVPICIGVLIIAVSWFFKSRRRKHCYPGLKQSLMMLPGLAAAVLGLCIYSLLETDANYPITHSIWHFAMASSIMFLLPKQQPPSPCADTSNDSDDTSLLDIASGPIETVNLLPAEDNSSINAIASDKDDVVLLD